MLRKYQQRAFKAATLNAQRACLVYLLDQIPFKHPPNMELERLDKLKARTDHELARLLTASLEVDKSETGSKLLTYLLGRKDFKKVLSKTQRNNKQRQLEIYLSCLMISLCIPHGVTIAQMRKAIGVRTLGHELKFLERAGLIRRVSTKNKKPTKIFVSKRILHNLSLIHISEPTRPY